MKITRHRTVLAARFALASRVALAAASPAFGMAALVAGATTLAGCADENDPSTWVKRLEDPAQRAPAIKRLSQFFEDGMTKASGNRDDAVVKGILDKIVEPMTKQYTAGTLDDKTRKELMKTLADTRDPRTAPALAKAFNEYEPGKNDDDVKFAAQSVNGMADAGKLTDQNLVDALWNCFSKFQMSKTKSFNLTKDLQDAVLSVKHPSYGPKAVEKLAAPVDEKSVDSKKDQVMFWQLTSVRLLGDLKFGAGAKALVSVMLTPSKADLRGPVNAALLKMPKEGEQQLLAAISGSDPDFAKLATFYPDKSHIAFLADSVAYISRPAARDALLGQLASADNDANRVVIAQSLYRFPGDARIVPAFLDAYKKVPANFQNPLLGGDSGRTALLRAAAQLYDANLVDWLLKEVQTAAGDEMEAMHSAGLQSAMKLATAAKVGAVKDAVQRFGSEIDKQVMPLALGAVDKCKQDAGCYSKLLDEPIPSSPRFASMTAIKAAYMTAIHGTPDTGRELYGKIEKVKNGSARLAVAQAINHLMPAGDVAAADALDKMVEADKSSGNKEFMAADNDIVKIALALRARAMP